MLKLNILDKTYVTGRGDIVLISLKDNDLPNNYGQEFINQEVKIHGKIYVITGVERHVHPTSSMNTYGDRVGLVIKEIL